MGDPLMLLYQSVMSKKLVIILKGHWTTSASSPIFFFKKVEIFISLEVYTYVVTAC